MTNSVNHYKPDKAICPGETLKETLEAIGMPQTELATRCGRPNKTINEIIQGKAQIMPDTALQFERVLGIPAKFWLNLEANYQETQSRIKENERLKTEATGLSKFPYNEMAEYGWVKLVQDKIDKVRELLSFLAINSFEQLKTIDDAVFSKASIKNYSPYAMSAWLRQGEIEAKNIETKPFNKKKAKEIIDGIKTLSRTMPKGFYTELKSKCAEAGIAVVAVPHLKHTAVQGAVRWLAPDKPLLQMSLRYKWNDVFWFHFFHEYGHILLHKKRDTFIDIDKQDKDALENEADEFAAVTLFPTKKYEEFKAKHDYSRESIYKFAEQMNVCPAQVVGRLQREGELKYTEYSDMKIKFEFAKQG